MKQALREQALAVGNREVAFTPKGGCPLKLIAATSAGSTGLNLVAFTPKGGCPLKL